MKGFEEEVKDLAIGEKIRKLRREMDLTLQQLSDKTGLSKPLLSQVENGHVVPPVATLIRIARSLGVNISHFFQEEEEDLRVAVTRPDERKNIGVRAHHPSDEMGYSYE
ncbi:helix-turn-helix transcriptional regulator, partial [bacterium]